MGLFGKTKDEYILTDVEGGYLAIQDSKNKDSIIYLYTDDVVEITTIDGKVVLGRIKRTSKYRRLNKESVMVPDVTFVLDTSKLLNSNVDIIDLSEIKDLKVVTKHTSDWLKQMKDDQIVE